LRRYVRWLMPKATLPTHASKSDGDEFAGGRSLDDRGK